MEFLVSFVMPLLASLLLPVVLLVSVVLLSSVDIFLFSPPERRGSALVRPRPADAREEVCICCGEVRRKYSGQGTPCPPTQVDPSHL